MLARRLALSIVAVAGCNVIFGIDSPEEKAPASASTSTTTATSSTAASGGDGGSGVGGAGGMVTCPANKIPPCHPGTGGGASPFCDPIVVSNDANGMPIDNYAIGVAVVGDWLYWANGSGQIVRASYDGKYDAIFGMGNDSVFVATDSTRVYWTDWNNETVRSATLDPPHDLLDISASPTGSQAFLGHIVERDDMIYWAATNAMPSVYGVYAAETSGTQPLATLVALKTEDTQQSDSSNGVAVDDAYVYWTDAGKVRRIPLDMLGVANAIEDFASDPGAGDMVVDDERVYWLADAGLSSKLKDGTGYIHIDTPGERARGLMLDEGYVVWTTDAGRIVRADRSGGGATVEIVTQGPSDAYALAADCGAIYWSTFAFSHGLVYKVRKPE